MVVLRCYAWSLHGCFMAMHIISRVLATFIEERIYGMDRELSRLEDPRSKDSEFSTRAEVYRLTKQRATDRLHILCNQMVARGKDRND